MIAFQDFDDSGASRKANRVPSRLPSQTEWSRRTRLPWSKPEASAFRC